MKLTFSDAFTTCKQFEVLRELIDDAPLHITHDGLKITALDPGHVAVVIATWPKDQFLKYEFDGEDMTLGLKISNLIKILKFAKKGDVLHMDVESGESDAMTVIVENEERHATFTMKLVDITADEMGIPELEMDACVTIPSAEFQLLVKDLGTLSDSVTISTIEGKGVKFEVVGDIGQASITLHGVEVQKTTEVCLSFAIRYLASFSKASAIAENVALKLTNEMPLCVEFKGESCLVKYYLAPKLDENDADDVDMD